MGRNAPHRERRTERPFPRRHERNARAWALHRSAYGLTTVPIHCVAVPSWKIELLFMTFHPSPACRALLHLLYLLRVVHVIPSCLLARRRRAGGAGRTSPCRGVGQRPTSLQSQLLSILLSPACASTPKICINLRNLRFPPFVSFVISNHSGSPSCIFVVLCALRVSPAGQTLHSSPTPPSVAPQGRPFSGARKCPNQSANQLISQSANQLISQSAVPRKPAACAAPRIALIYRNIRQFNQRNTHGKRQVLQRQAASA